MTDLEAEMARMFHAQQYPPQKNYDRLFAAGREINALLPEATSPWEVVQIALEFTDYIVRAERVTEATDSWMTSPEHEKAGIFVHFLKNVYGKHQSKPLDEEDH